MARTNCVHTWTATIYGSICSQCRHLRDGAGDHAGITPRNDFVLVRICDLGMVRGVAMPEQAIHGKEFVVVAYGPDVKDLAIGDKVQMIGKMGEDYAPLPSHRDLIVIKQANIILRVGVAADLSPRSVLEE